MFTNWIIQKHLNQLLPSSMFTTASVSNFVLIIEFYFGNFCFLITYRTERLFYYKKYIYASRNLLFVDLFLIKELLRLKLLML